MCISGIVRALADSNDSIQLLTDLGTNLSNPQQCTAAELHIETKTRMNSHKFCTQALRLATFTKWPVGLSQCPEMLAEAGFHYLSSNIPNCFLCLQYT